MVDAQSTDVPLISERVGDRLRAARMKAGLDLNDVATRTRVPLRHLQAIESGDYSALPAVTYAVGFVKSYARTVGEDADQLAAGLREELGEAHANAVYDAPGYEDADPARMPSRMLAWTAAGLLALVAIGYGVWRTEAVSDPAPQTAEISDTQNSPPENAPALPAASPPVAVANASGQVTLTAREAVWVRIYDANDKVLFEKEMAKGERIDVPAAANAPKIRTGRAELIDVTINGSAVAPLGAPERTIKDVGISAAALTARAPVVPIVPPAGNSTAGAAPAQSRP